MRKILIATIVVILLSFLVSGYFYTQMPNRMATHWDMNGVPNGYLSKWSIFLMPAVSLLLFLLLIWIIRIDPLKKNIGGFQKEYSIFILLIVLFLNYIGLLEILWNLGVSFSINIAIIPAFAVLFYYCGILLEKSKRNWFIGVRTPWTLSNDKVWEKTNKLSAKIFKAFGAASLLTVLIPAYFAYFVLLLIPIFVWIFFYSYFLYKKFKK